MRRTRIEPASPGEMNFLFICMLISFLAIGIGSKLGFTPTVITFAVIFGACAVGMIVKFVVNEVSQTFFNNRGNDSEEALGSTQDLTVAGTHVDRPAARFVSTDHSARQTPGEGERNTMATANI